MWMDCQMGGTAAGGGFGGHRWDSMCVVGGKHIAEGGVAGSCTASLGRPWVAQHALWVAPPQRVAAGLCGRSFGGWHSQCFLGGHHRLTGQTTQEGSSRRKVKESGQQVVRLTVYVLTWHFRSMMCARLSIQCIRCVTRAVMTWVVGCAVRAGPCAPRECAFGRHCVCGDGCVWSWPVQLQVNNCISGWPSAGMLSNMWLTGVLWGVQHPAMCCVPSRRVL